MAQVVQATCPGCKKVLRIPTDWIDKTLRCKKCGTVVQLPQSPSSPTLAEPAAPLPQAILAPSAAESPTAGNNNVDSPPPLEGMSAPMSTVPEFSAFASETGEPIIRTRVTARRRSKRLRTRPPLLVGVVLLGIGIAVTCQYWPQFPDSTATIPGPPKKNLPLNPLPESVVFPRRALAISVNDYVYANPVSALNVHTLVQQLARVLHVPANQVVELSDVPPLKPIVTPGQKPAGDSQRLGLAAKATPPLKPVIEKTISSFVESSRAQDRVVVLFVGHVVEIGAEAYLVPVEGEPAVKETLIPLSWLYEQLARCKAQQKVLILDTCRFDTNQGLERPGSGPMTAALDALLQKPPAGVQVWSACTSGQYSYESYGSAFFLDKLDEALTSSVLKKIQEPQEPLPIEALAQVVNQSTATEVATRVASLDGQKAVQTPRLTGQMAEQGAPYDKEEPLPRRIEIPTPPQPAGGVAKQEQVQSILQEIDLPPLKMVHHQHAPMAMARLLPFSAEVIEHYRPDYSSIGEIEQGSARHPLRSQVIEAVKLLRATFDPTGPQSSLRESFQGASTERIKAEILKEQQKPALVHDQLMERLEALRKAGEQRDKETSPRWQAHYDTILAQLLARTAYVSEYNLMLGKIRKDELPELRPKVHTGWRLASCEKMQSGKDVKDMAAESKKLFAKVIREHPGTPWEMLAKREQLTALGLEWQPSS